MSQLLLQKVNSKDHEYSLTMSTALQAEASVRSVFRWRSVLGYLKWFCYRLSGGMRVVVGQWVKRDVDQKLIMVEWKCRNLKLFVVSHEDIPEWYYLPLHSFYVHLLCPLFNQACGDWESCVSAQSPSGPNMGNLIHQIPVYSLIHSRHLKEALHV